jgi:hypothetical protein
VPHNEQQTGIVVVAVAETAPRRWHAVRYFARRRVQVASYGSGKHLPRRKTALIEEGLKRRNMPPANELHWP